MARVVVAAVAAVAVGYFAGPAAGFQTFAIVYGATGFLDPATKVQGPRLDDLKSIQASEGVPIPYIEGSWRTAGTYIWSSDKQEVATTEEQGKGGPNIESTTYTYKMDVLILLSINPLDAVRRVWSNGRLVWSAAADADDETIAASADTTSWEDLRFYSGSEDQMPDPDYEAAVGIGNAPAYRGRATIFIKGLNLGGSGQIPILHFEVVSSATVANDVVMRDVSMYQATLLGDTQEGTDENVKFSGALDSRAAGGGAYVGTPNTSIFDFGQDNFTAEGWLYIDEDTNSGRALVSNRVAGGLENGWILWLDTSGRLAFTASNANLSVVNIVSDTTFPLNVWTPWAVSREGNTFKIYENGSIVAQGLASEDNPEIGDTGGGVWVNTDPRGAYGSVVGLYEQVRVTRNPSQYTVPTAPYPLNPEDPNEVFHLVISAGIRVTPQIVTLDGVVSRICNRTGLLTNSDIDVSQLSSDVVRGFAVAQGSGRQAIETLMAAYLFECVESGVISFIKRGGLPALTIGYDELGASEGQSVEPLPLSRANDIELPAKVNVKFSNQYNDFQDGTATIDRLVTPAVSVTNTELPVVLTPLEAQRIADSQVMDLQVSLITLGPVSLSRRYAALIPTDVVLVEGKDGSQFRARIQKITDSSVGVRTLELVLDDASITQSVAEADDTDYSTVLVKGVSGTASLYIDGPIARDADNNQGFYALAKAAETEKRWPGAVIFSSPDNDIYEREQSISERAVFGPCLTTLGPWGAGRVFDEVNSVEVDVGVALTNASRDALLNDQTVNACAIGSPDTGWEYLQFRNATPTGDGVYVLSGLLRGSRGTEWRTTHSSGETFALLRPQGIRRILVETTEIGQPRYYKAVTIDKTVASTAPTVVTNNAVGLKPFSPVNARKEDGTDIIISWQRRSRLAVRMIGSSGVSVPLGEEIEAYSVDIMDGDTVLRTINTTTEEATYTSAMQSADGYSPGDPLQVAIYQISTVVGRGYPLEATL